MKLFTMGPVPMYPETLNLAARQIPYFRTSEFSKSVLQSEDILLKLAGAGQKARAVFLTSSGTGAMEATIINCLTKSDYVLVIDGGSFGHRFVEMCALHEIPHKVLRIEFGQILTKESLQEYHYEPFTALLVNIHESSTCQLYNLKLLSEFCRQKSMCFIVDAISSFLADPINIAGSGIDALILSSQKAFALAPGLSIIILSQKMIEERIQNIKCKSMYFNFSDYLDNGIRGQTPFTPAVSIILQLQSRLIQIESKGVNNMIAQTAGIAEDFRKQIEKLPVELPCYPMSNAATALIFPRNNAGEVYKFLIKQGITLTPNGGGLATRVLRVGHIGAHLLEENKMLTNALDTVLNLCIL